MRVKAGITKEQIMELWKYLQANNNVANQNDRYRYTPSQADINTLRGGVNIDNLRKNGKPVSRYKGVLHGRDEDTE